MTDFDDDNNNNFIINNDINNIDGKLYNQLKSSSFSEIQHNNLCKNSYSTNTLDLFEKSLSNSKKSSLKNFFSIRLNTKTNNSTSLLTKTNNTNKIKSKHDLLNVNKQNLDNNKTCKLNNKLMNKSSKKGTKINDNENSFDDQEYRLNSSFDTYDFYDVAEQEDYNNKAIKKHLSKSFTSLVNGVRSLFHSSNQHQPQHAIPLIIEPLSAKDNNESLNNSSIASATFCQINCKNNNKEKKHDRKLKLKDNILFKTLNLSYNDKIANATNLTASTTKIKNHDKDVKKKVSGINFIFISKS